VVGCLVLCVWNLLCFGCGLVGLCGFLDGGVDVWEPELSPKALSFPSGSLDRIRPAICYACRRLGRS